MGPDKKLSKVSKITHYLYGCIQRIGGSSEQLPGETELCRKFSVARGTVQRAVAGMMQGKYIVKLPGRHGLFVNPKMVNMIPTAIGIVANSGITEILASSSANVFAGFVKKLTRNADCEYLFHDLSETDPASIYALAKDNGLRGILWIMSDGNKEAFESFEAIIQESFPVIAVCYPFDSMFPQPAFNAVTRDYLDTGKRLAEFAWNKGFQNPLLVGECKVTFEGFLSRFKKLGGQFQMENHLEADEHFSQRFAEALKRGKVDCIISGGGVMCYKLLSAFMNSNEQAGMLPMILRNYFLTNKFIHENPALKILVFPEQGLSEFMFKSGEAAARMLQELIENPNQKIPTKLIKS